MHIVITGAAGFVGAGLARKLISQGLPDRPAPTRVTLVDRQFSGQYADARVRMVTGDFGAPAVLDRVFETPADLVFHLASVPGGQAEREFALAYQANLLAPLALFERAASRNGGPGPRIVFASSIAVYGGVLQDPVDEATPPRPGMSYGVHKLVGELVLADLSRRRMVDGVSLRLPGIVARPGLSAGHGSAFMSAIMRAAEEGAAYTCPVSPQASCWWMSLGCCVDNLLHAGAELDTGAMDAGRSLALPVLHLEVGAIMEALARRFGKSAVARIRFMPDPAIEQVFGRMPALSGMRAEALGFRHDGDSDRLVERALG